MPFVLKVAAGAGEGGEFSFDSQEARLGRTADNEIVVKDSSASRSHARVFEKNGRYFVEDLQSANGTKHNGLPLTAPQPIKHGDTIAIGEVVFRFETETGADEVDAEPPTTEAEADRTGENPAHPEPDDADRTRANAVPPNHEEPSEPTEPPETRIGAPPPTRRPAPPPPKPLPARSKTGAAVEKPNEDNTRAVKVGPPAALSKSSSAVPKATEGKASARLSAHVPRASDDEVSDDGTREVNVSPPKALAKSSASAKLSAPDDDEGTRERPMPAAALRKRPTAALAEEDSETTVAELARRRREIQKSSFGRATLKWESMPRPLRLAFGGIIGLIVVGGLASMVISVIPQPALPKKPEPMELIPNGRTLNDSFGSGENVTFKTPDLKSFNLTLNAPVQVVGVLHFYAKEMAANEVVVTLNGAQVGTVEADTLDDSRELELVLPAKLLKPNQLNQIVFDSVRNPPADDPWRVWGIWVESLPTPQVGPEETQRMLHDAFERGQKFYDSRDIGAENLFKAWKTYREAWLILESQENRSDELYLTARTRMREIRPELDNKCNKMLLEFTKLMNLKPPNIKRAKLQLEEVFRYFPTREHPCFNFSKAVLEDLPPM